MSCSIFVTLDVQVAPVHALAHIVQTKVDGPSWKISYDSWTKASVKATNTVNFPNVVDQPQDAVSRKVHVTVRLNGLSLQSRFQHI